MITTELKHTPGEWVPVNGRDNYFIDGPNEYNVDDEGRHSICELFGPDAAENQKIILAAPLLLSALMEACSACECYMRLTQETHVPAWYLRAQDALAAAGVTFKPLQP